MQSASPLPVKAPWWIAPDSCIITETQLVQLRAQVHIFNAFKTNCLPNTEQLAYALQNLQEVPTRHREVASGHVHASTSGRQVQSSHAIKRPPDGKDVEAEAAAQAALIEKRAAAVKRKAGVHHFSTFKKLVSKDDVLLSPLRPPETKNSTLDAWVLEKKQKMLASEQRWKRSKAGAQGLMEAKIIELRKEVANEEDFTKKARAIVQLKQLSLLQVQFRLRRTLMNDFYKPIDPILVITTRVPKFRDNKRVKRLLKLEAKHREDRLKRKRDKQEEFFKSLEQQGQEMEELYKAKRERIRGINRYVKEFHKRKERAHRERLERVQREKISLLKANDVEGYLRMVQDVKSDRVQQLLKETEGYLHRLGLKLQHEKQAHSIVSATGAIENITISDVPETSQDFVESNHIYYTLAHSVKEVILEQPNILTGGKLRAYQMSGLQWLVSLYNNHLNGILADEMGLGKTVQVISLLCYLMEVKKVRGPFLIVVPSSVLPNWISELNHWAPSIRKVAYHGIPDERRRLFKDFVAEREFDVLVTTFDFLMNKLDRPRLTKIEWQYLIIDEGHRIKNANCKLNADLKLYNSSRRLLLTGTPIQNNLDELWTLLNFLLPNIFNSSVDFAQWFNKPFETVVDSNPEQALLTEEENLLLINRLHQVLRPFMLRRLKEKVESELPQKKEMLVRCEASAYQRVLMQHATQKMIFASAQKSKTVHNTVMELRNICNHPFLSHLHVEQLESMLPPHYLPPMIRLCGKMEALDRILPKLKTCGHKVLFFCTMTRLLDVMEDYLAWKGWRYLRLDGSTHGSERGNLINEFNRPESEAFIFLLSIRAGGVGINLQAADTVIIYDTDWNPQVDLQAQARAHRIGQKREVLVLRMETVRSVEAKVRAAAEYKLGVANQSITAGFFDDNTSAEDRRQYLEALLRESSPGDFADSEPVLDDASLNRLFARSEQEFEDFEAYDQARLKTEKSQWSLIQSAGCGTTGSVVDSDQPSVAPRLLTDAELKPVLALLQQDSEASKDRPRSTDMEEYGRGKRGRDAKKYNYSDLELEQEENEDRQERFRGAKRKQASDQEACAAPKGREPEKRKKTADISDQASPVQRPDSPSAPTSAIPARQLPLAEASPANLIVSTTSLQAPTLEQLALLPPPTSPSCASLLGGQQVPPHPASPISPPTNTAQCSPAPACVLLPTNAPANSSQICDTGVTAVDNVGNAPLKDSGTAGVIPSDHLDPSPSTLSMRKLLELMEM